MAGIDEFLDQVTVLPPGEWDPSIRIEPPKNVPSQVTSPFMPIVNADLHCFCTKQKSNKINILLTQKLKL